MGYLADEVGYPFNQIPTQAFIPFKSGVVGWGSMCGALPPAIAVISLVADGAQRDAMVGELMAWYAEAPFPIYQPKGLDLPGVAVNSSLCHVSVTKWMNETGFGPRSTPERKERCAGLTADICKKTVEMLNQFVNEGVFAATLGPSAVVGECMTCHSELVKPYAHGKENCVECHGDHTK